MSTDRVERVESALLVLPSLIDLHPFECQEVALDLSRVLLNYNDSLNIDKFAELQFDCLVRLCTNYPLIVGEYLTREFYERNYTIQQRSLIIRTIERSARNLSELKSIEKKIGERLTESVDEDQSDEQDHRPVWKSIIEQRLKVKSKYNKAKRQLKRQVVEKENRFGSIVGHFFFPLVNKMEKERPFLSLFDDDHDNFLLCELLSCLGRLCIHAQNTFILENLVKHLFELLKTLSSHPNGGVRHAVIYAYACALVSFNGRVNDELLQSDLIELKVRFDEIVVRDSNTDVQKLTRQVRMILLKTLHEMSL